MKKAAALLLSLVLLLTACGGGTEGSQNGASPTPALSSSSEDSSTPPILVRALDLGDAQRALDLGLADIDWGNRNAKEQMTVAEYKFLLTNLLAQLTPDTLANFDSHVNDSDIPLIRGMGLLMSWYAAVELGINTYNTDFDLDQVRDQDDFWWLDESVYDTIFPTWAEGMLILISAESIAFPFYPVIT